MAGSCVRALFTETPVPCSLSYVICARKVGVKHDFRLSVLKARSKLSDTTPSMVNMSASWRSELARLT
eukprot:3050903-Lingulodinium_polyedra.AAC.1